MKKQFNFTTFSYKVRKINGHVNSICFAQYTTFTNRCKAVARLEGENFDEDNQILHTLLRISVVNCCLIHHNKLTKKNGQSAWRDQLD